MKISGLWTTIESESFYVASGDFASLLISETANKGFYYFKGNQGLIKYFVLDNRDKVQYLAEVTLIKKGDKFTPRIAFCIRDKSKKIIETVDSEKEKLLKARVSFDQCYENFWKLIAYIQSLSSVEVHSNSFSLIDSDQHEKLKIAQQLPPEKIKEILTKAVQDKKIKLDENELSLLQGRKMAVETFEQKLNEDLCDESWWQGFFEDNAWIFGYGLKYVFLSTEQEQPHYGGVKASGKGGQKGDYLVASKGSVRFTTLVEIKTPCTPLLSGSAEIRNGAWSFSKDLTDAISQIQANKSTWEKDGSRKPENMDRFEKDNDTFTVSPNGIIVIGDLSELKDSRSKQESFERFRNSISGVEIITFDELFERACFIVKPDTNGE